MAIMLDKYGKLFWSYANDASPTFYCIVGAVSLYAFYRLVVKKKYKLPPGPRGLPLLGNLLELQHEGFIEKCNEWQKKYGDIITIRLGPLNSVVISDADLLLEAFVSKSYEFSDRPFFYSLHMFTEGSKSILTSDFGEKFKYLRKVTSQSLRQYLTGSQFEERCHEVVLHMVKIIDTENEPFSLESVLSLGVFNVMHGLCFGSVKEFEDPSFQEIFTFFRELNQQFGNGFLEDVFPPLRYWPTKKFTLVLNRFMKFVGYIQEKTEERKAVMDKDSPRCLADNILLVQQKLRETDSDSLVYMTDVHTRQILMDVFGAGVDTNHITLEWIFLILVANPDIQARMHKEIDDVVGEKLPGREHRAKLVYTEAVILETMRLYAVSPVGVPHQTKLDSTLGGYDIPAKTTILINQLLILRDPKHWDDPLTFKPERFMNEDETSVTVRNRSFVPFSVGPRGCPGESLAKLHIVYFVVGLLQKFSFSLAPGEKADFTPEATVFSFRPQQTPKVVVKPR